MIIAVDFDGVLCENKYPEIGPPIIENINRIKKLQEQGDILILWTCRRERYLDEAIKWCKSFDLNFHYINENTEETIMRYEGDTRKIFADYYIDDKNLNTEGIDKLIESYNNALKSLNEYIVANERSSLCIFTDLCVNYISDDKENKNRRDVPFCKNSDCYDDNGVLLCKNLKYKDSKKLHIKNDNHQKYNIVNNPSHYTEGRKFEPAFVINDWGVNWYIGTCIKYLSRIGRKDDSDKEISKALWYIIAEIAMNHKDISKENLLKTIDEIYSRKEKYEQLKKE